ncbi:MAG: hypothetical protein RSD49_14305 [Hafnia sp.]
MACRAGELSLLYFLLMHARIFGGDGVVQHYRMASLTACILLRRQLVWRSIKTLAVWRALMTGNTG